MSDLKLNGVGLTEYTEGNIKTLGKYKGSDTNTSANSGKVVSKLSSGKNYEFKVNGVDIYEYNHGEWHEFTNSQWISVPSWCNHLSFTIRGGGGGGGGAAGSAYTSGYGQIGFTIAQPGGNGGRGGAATGTWPKNNASWYVTIGGGGGGGGRGRNVAASGGNSKVVGRDGDYSNDAYGGNGAWGGGSHVYYVNGNHWARYLDANGGAGGTRGVPGKVRRSGYGDDAHILENSYAGTDGNNGGNSSLNTTNYGDYFPRGNGGGRGNAYRHQNNNVSSQMGGINWDNTWYRSYPQNEDWNYQPNAGGNGDHGWARVFFRRSE